MGKVHTRTKRKFSRSTHLGSIKNGSRTRKARQKSFSSEEIAKKWAEAQGIKKFELRNRRPEYASKKKIIIIQK